MQVELKKRLAVILFTSRHFLLTPHDETRAPEFLTTGIPVNINAGSTTADRPTGSLRLQRYSFFEATFFLVW
jgi:hypothetical protein